MDRRFKLDNYQQMTMHLGLFMGGMGDILHAAPALRYIFKQFPWQKYRVYTPEYLLPLFKKMFKKQIIRGFGDMPKEVDGKTHGIINPNIQRNSSMRIHLTDFAFYSLIDMLPITNNDRNFLELKPGINVKVFNLPSKYVIISPYSRVNNRQFIPKELDAIARYIISKGYHIVLLGADKQLFNAATKLYTTGQRFWHPTLPVHDLSGSTSVLEALEIIWRADALVTVDGGLMHLAALTDTPVIAGFTTVDPVTRIPYKNGKQATFQIRAVIPDVSCRFCQTKTCMVYNGQFEFDKCYVGDLKCLEELTAEKFIKHLGEVL